LSLDEIDVTVGDRVDGRRHVLLGKDDPSEIPVTERLAAPISQVDSCHVVALEAPDEP
jgi:hypothetical protein